ncbi:uncharacterized protein PG998_012964 [Apiospora kogelbergensis]|uniref:uncharacterized protein n=1 Tax=Apiospora kogelbergensis TaxID=1337665 RepID=UPI003131380E
MKSSEVSLLGEYGIPQHVAEFARETYDLGVDVRQYSPIRDLGTAPGRTPTSRPLIEWQDEHALPVETARNFTRPAQGDSGETPISDEHFRIYGIGRKVDLHHGEAHEQSYQEGS